jgi:hypothetical protein
MIRLESKSRKNNSRSLRDQIGNFPPPVEMRVFPPGPGKGTTYTSSSPESLAWKDKAISPNTAANFDLSTGLTFSGAVNVATRSGGNELHGSAFYFFRDHKLSAYPALQREPANPDPFFQRQQFGFAVGGPILHDRVFFFANWERNDQRGVAATTLFGPDFAHFSGINATPLLEN